MNAEERTRFEQAIRAACERQQFAAATTQLLEGLGGELYGFLLATCPSETDASDVFSALTEQLWRGLPTFRWKSSLRTWAYAVARHAALDHLKAGRRRRAVMLTGDERLQLSQVEAKVRTQTHSYLKTARRSALDALRAALPADDQRLLVLRVDRDLAWDELAEIFLGDAAADAAALKKESARLRKRFQLVKERLLADARKQGLLAGPAE